MFTERDRTNLLCDHSYDRAGYKGDDDCDRMPDGEHVEACSASFDDVPSIWGERLVERVKDLMARAWDEGREGGADEERNGYWVNGKHASLPNPYRDDTA